MSGKVKTGDDGFAMFIAMAAIAVMTIVSVAGYWLSMDTLRESGRVQAENKAFQVASSGLERELQTFTTSNFVNGSYTRTGTTPDGNYTVYSSATGNPYEFQMSCLGRSGNTTESVMQRFFFMSLWDMNIGAGPAVNFGGGSGWNGNASVRGPLYVRGDMDWWANATLEGGPLLIRDGGLIASGSGTVGAAKPIYLFATDGLSGPKAKSNVYLADGVVHQSVPDVKLPWVDNAYLADMFDQAKSQSCDNNMGAPSRNINNTEAMTKGTPSYPMGATTAAGATDHYKYIGPSLGPSALGAGTTSLSIGATSFGRYPGNGYGTSSALHDDFAFDKATGTLYVEGVVFVDGPVTIGSGVTRYVGNGEIFANGDVTVATSMGPASGLSNEQCLGIVTPGDVSINGHLTGAVFCNGQLGLWGTFSSFEGSGLAGELYGDLPNIQIIQNPLISQCLPQSMPAAGGGFVFGGSWSRF